MTSTDVGPRPAAGDGGVDRPDRSWQSWGSWARLGGTAAVGLVIDIVTKYVAFAHVAGRVVPVDREQVIEAKSRGLSLGVLVPSHEPVRVVPGLLEFTLVLNPGAVFGIGAGRRWFFVGFTVVALAVSVWMFTSWTRARDRWAHMALGLIIAGGVGNLYDRVRYACVRDFIHPLPGVGMPFGWRNPLTGGREIWPYVSNVADLWLIIGIVILMGFLWRGEGSKGR